MLLVPCFEQHRPPQRLGRREAQLQEQAQWGLQLRGFCMAIANSVYIEAQAQVAQCSVQGSQAIKAKRIREKQRAYEESLRPRQLLIPNDRTKPITVLQLEPGFESPEVSESELTCGIATAMGCEEFFQLGQFEVVQLPDDTDGIVSNALCKTTLYCGGLTSVGLEHQEDEVEGYYLGDHPEPPAFSARWMFESHKGFNRTPGENVSALQIQTNAVNMHFSERLYRACNQRASLLSRKPVFGDVVWRRVGGTRAEQQEHITFFSSHRSCNCCQTSCKASC